MVARRRPPVRDHLHETGSEARPTTTTQAYEAFVTGLAKQWQERPGVIFDLWNEPNGSYFWTGTETRQLETFRRTHDVIRRVLGTEAVIAGPSRSAAMRTSRVAQRLFEHHEQAVHPEAEDSRAGGAASRSAIPGGRWQ